MLTENNESDRKQKLKEMKPVSVLLSIILTLSFRRVSLDGSTDCLYTGHTEPVTCGNKTCFNGNCQSKLLYGLSLEIIRTCSCLDGWHGISCDVCNTDDVTGSGAEWMPQIDDVTHSDVITDDPISDTGNLPELPPFDLNISLPTLPRGDAPDVTPDSVFPDQFSINFPPFDTNITWTVDPANVTSPEFCMGTAIPDSTPTKCRGLTCHHGTCVSVPLNDEPWPLIGYRCVCDAGWTGSHCDFCCDLACNQGDCHVDQETNQKYCVCHNSNYSVSSNCTELIQRPAANHSVTPPWLWGVTGLGCVLLLALVLTMILLPYYMWRNRPILLLKLMHFFQKYDDSEKLFHVFISYRSSADDESFVVRKLHPKLEEMNLRVCVHYKDFLPGATIAENIIKAVENSSRSILLLSPDYCCGEWPRFEVQTAQREMLKLRHRIVPIIFKDISDSREQGAVDMVLTSILDSVTYLEWPGTEDEKAERKFWERLRLAMPKIRAQTVQAPQVNEKMSTDDAVSVDLTNISLGYDPGQSLPYLDTSLDRESSLDSGVSMTPGSSIWLSSASMDPKLNPFDFNSKQIANDLDSVSYGSNGRIVKCVDSEI